MLRYRSLSALVLIPPIIGLTFLGGGGFGVLVAVVLTLAGYEYAQIIQHGGAQANPVLVIGFCWLALVAAYYPTLELVWPGVAAFMCVTLAWALIRFERGARTAVTDWAFTLAGGLYLGWTGAHFVLLREMTVKVDGQVVGVGLGLTMLGLVSVWLVDTGAYAVGIVGGRHKLAPRLSPNKSWEGYAGGLLSGVSFGAAWPWLAGVLHVGQLPGMTVWHSMVLCGLIATLTPLGDLGESMLKRWANVKDSGNLIPGHGGMFDRLDTLLWTAVIVYCYARWMV